MLFVFAALLATVALSGKGDIEWIGALAVLLTFGHVQVADRLAEEAAEKEQLTGEADVECHRMARRYLISKELCWFAYFFALGAYSALVGVGVFLLYPVWRRSYRYFHPRISH